jgi:hypothetical protein
MEFVSTFITVVLNMGIMVLLRRFAKSRRLRVYNYVTHIGKTNAHQILVGNWKEATLETSKFL